MSIRINKDKCVGCRKCEVICPGNLIFTDKDNKAYIRYPKDCWGCTSCIKECNFQAIDFFLGADIGGNGAVCYTKQEDDTLKWVINNKNNIEKVIEINKKNANAY